MLHRQEISLAFSGCGTWFSDEQPLSKKGEYRLSGWYKENKRQEKTFFPCLKHNEESEQVDRARSVSGLAMRYGSSLHKVPLYVGEFTMHANPERESVVGYLQDLIGIMRDEGLHWSFWEYYSEYPGVGLYTGDLRLANPEARDVLKRSLGE
jgi:hypothetical protein